MGYLGAYMVKVVFLHEIFYTKKCFIILVGTCIKNY